MRYSIEPRKRIYIKGYGFLSFSKNMGNEMQLDTTDAIKQKEEFKKQQNKLVI